MARMFTNSIHYVHEKSSMVELNEEIPISQPKIQADAAEVFQDNMKELVADLVNKAKEIDALIEMLPGIDQTEEDQMNILQSLEIENREANEDFGKAVGEMEKVKAQINQSLRLIADEQSSLVK
ncbi:hypothetical protein BDB01DRAFT_769087 [Pilobolus umbonatus]|nr:hypothetical protein BDB01DRAFT_769087 [Pilobolus umbonatus]